MLVELAESNETSLKIPVLKKPALSGKLFYYLFPFRKKTVLNNMNLVFRDRLSRRQIKELAQGFYGHLLKLILENLAGTCMSDKETLSQVRVLGHENIARAREKNSGVLLLAGHFGNWEVTPVAAMSQFKEFRGRFHILRRLLTNKFFEKILFRRFYKAGLSVIPKRGSLEQVLEALKKNDIVTFIMDQYANPSKDGILVDFFGVKTGTFKSLAVIARQTGAPVIPVVCYRESDGKHMMHFSEPILWIENPDCDREIYENTREYNRVLEEMVYAHPDQWLWAHRRWKVK